jgi:hypothetical protein
MGRLTLSLASAGFAGLIAWLLVNPDSNEKEMSRRVLNEPGAVTRYFS